MAHGFAGVRGMRLGAFAEIFALNGYAVLVFDYRCFGDSAGEPRQLLHIPRQLQDWRAAAEHARSLPGVDGDRVVLWGTSLSGGHVLSQAARDPRVAAVISQVPHVSGIAAAAAVGPRQSLRLGLRGVADQIRGAVGAGPVYIKAFGTPGELAAMTSPDTRAGADRLYASSDPPRPSEQVTARTILHMALYSPGRLARRIRCPVLVQVVDADAITPTAPARRVAQRMRRAVVKDYPGGHFDPYVDPLFPAVVADQLQFLHHVVPA